MLLTRPLLFHVLQFRLLGDIFVEINNKLSPECIKYRRCTFSFCFSEAIRNIYSGSAVLLLICYCYNCCILKMQKLDI